MPKKDHLTLSKCRQGLKKRLSFIVFYCLFDCLLLSFDVKKIVFYCLSKDCLLGKIAIFKAVFGCFFLTSSEPIFLISWPRPSQILARTRSQNFIEIVFLLSFIVFYCLFFFGLSFYFLLIVSLFFVFYCLLIKIWFLFSSKKKADYCDWDISKYILPMSRKKSTYCQWCDIYYEKVSKNCTQMVA